MPMLVRIRPNCPRQVHVIEGLTFRREKGWYRLEDDALAGRLEDEPLNDPDDGQKVFDVKSEDEATVIADVETKKADPAGTPSAPHSIMPTVIEAPTARAPKAATVPANIPGAPRGGRRMRNGGGAQGD